MCSNTGSNSSAARGPNQNLDLKLRASIAQSTEQITQYADELAEEQWAA
jgi:hypothetical protein